MIELIDNTSANCVENRVLDPELVVRESTVASPLATAMGSNIISTDNRAGRITQRRVQ